MKRRLLAPATPRTDPAPQGSEGVGCVSVPNLTRQDARARADLLEVESYDIDLDLPDGGGNPGEHTFRSRTTIRFGCRRPGEDTFVDLIAAGLRSVTLNGEAVDARDYAP